ncbi:MurR/RpiR family transcriptional regulator [Shinella zoogloeoides]|uniref:MurR/RpiR family transcriptional regulator n=1 Tax=Shinella zoogloeoides TaxID=352475 RepID=UPI0028A99251|nr:MurR/RpiR family transcriptional regulator [Shinella zoogloeoides]
MILDRLREALATFTSAERRVAELILLRPYAAVSWTISDVSQLAKSSDSTVIRLCRKMGCSGFPTLKIEIAKALAVARQVLPTTTSESDPVVATFDDILIRSEQALRNARADTDVAEIESAARRLLRARRIEIYGFAGSGFLSHELQFRLALMKLPAIAYTDPSIQNSVAPLLDADDVVIAISISGLTQYVIDSVNLAKKSGAFVISISQSSSLLAKLSNINIALNAYRETENRIASPTGRIAFFMIFDFLCSAILMEKTKK